jgi:hypothetical protein
MSSRRTRKHFQGCANREDCRSSRISSERVSEIHEKIETWYAQTRNPLQTYKPLFRNDWYYGIWLGGSLTAAVLLVIFWHQNAVVDGIAQALVPFAFLPLVVEEYRVVTSIRQSVERGALDTFVRQRTISEIDARFVNDLEPYPHNVLRFVLAEFGLLRDRMDSGRKHGLKVVVGGAAGAITLFGFADIIRRYLVQSPLPWVIWLMAGVGLFCAFLYLDADTSQNIRAAKRVIALIEFSLGHVYGEPEEDSGEIKIEIEEHAIAIDTYSTASHDPLRDVKP